MKTRRLLQRFLDSVAVVFIVSLTACGTRDGEPAAVEQQGTGTQAAQVPAEVEVQRPVVETPSPPISPALEKTAAIYHRFGTTPTEPECIQFGKSLEHAIQSDDLLAAVNAIDWDAMFEAASGGTQQARRQFPAIVSAFEAQLPRQYRRWERFIDQVAAGGSFRFLRVRRADGRAAALFRFFEADGSFLHLELPLVKQPDGEVRAINVYTHQTGTLTSEVIREAYLLVTRVQAAGGLDKVDATLREQVEHFPKIVQISDHLGDDQYAQVLDVYEQLPESLKHNRRAMLSLMTAAWRIGEAEALAAALEEFHRHFPDDPSGNFIGGTTILLMNEEYDQYFLVIDHMEQIVGEDMFFDVARARAYLHQEDYSQARKLAQQAAEADPSLAVAWWSQVDVSLAEEDFDETLRLLKTISQKFDSPDFDLTAEAQYEEFVQSPQYESYVQWLELQPQASERPATPRKVAPVDDLASKSAHGMETLPGTEPMTAAALKRWYRLPEGKQDVTPLWLRALRPFGSDDFKSVIGRLERLGLEELWRVTDEDSLPLPGEPWDDLPEVEALLAEQETWLRRLHAAAATGGGAIYPIDFAAGYSIELPHAEQARSAVRLLAVEAFVRAHHGDTQGAAQSIQTMIRAGRTLRYEPIMVTQLVRVPLHQMAVRSLQRLLGRIEFSDEDLAVLQAELLANDYQDGLYRGLVGERVLGLWVFEKPMERVPERFVKYLDGPGQRPEDRAYYIDWMQRAIDTAHPPWPDCLRAGEKLLAEFDTVLDKDPNGERYVVALTIAPALSAFSEGMARADTTSRMAATAVAAERFRREHGQPPDNLSALVPNYLASLPIDPFDGNPLRYELLQQRLVVSSVGTSVEDDQRNLQFQMPLQSPPAEPTPEAQPADSRIAPVFRAWTDVSDKHTVEAELVNTSLDRKTKGMTVTLRKRDGAVVNIPFDQLSQESQSLVRRLGQLKRDVRMKESQEGQEAIDKLEAVGAWVHRAWQPTEKNPGVHIHVSGAEPSDELLSALRRIPDLTQVIWYDAAIGDAQLVHFTKISGLKELALDSPMISDEGVEHLVAIEGLSDLAIHSPKITDKSAAVIAGMKHLESLTLQSEQLTDTAARHLLAAPKLEHLDLWSSGITGDGLRTIARHKGLTSLHLATYQLRDEDLSCLQSLPKLQELELNAPQLSDAAVDELVKCKSIQTLNLHHTKLTAKGIGSLEQIKTLRNLSLLGEHLTHDEVRALSSIGQLRLLEIGYSEHITNKSILELKQLRGLKYLYIRVCPNVTEEAIQQLEKELPDTGISELAY